MRVANPNTEFVAVIYDVPTGQAGTLTFEIRDSDGNVVDAASTDNIIESPAGSGIYIATRTAPSDVGQYVLVWHGGEYAADVLYVTTSLGLPSGESAGWAPDYVSLETIKSALRIPDNNDDLELALAISAASRAVDHYTNRQFGILDEPATWYYDAAPYQSGRWTLQVPIDDLMDLTDLVVKADSDREGNFETTLTFDEDFRIGPRNAAVQGKPFTYLILAGSTYRSVEVTARFGWTAVPAGVVQATLTKAIRFFKRKDSPFGIAGSPEFGTEMRLLAKLDPDVQLNLSPLRKAWGAV